MTTNAEAIRVTRLPSGLTIVTERMDRVETVSLGAYVATGSRQQWRSGGLFSGRQNQELPDFTQGLYDARAMAMERVTRDAHALHAHGVVGVQIDRSQREYEREINNTTYTDLIISMHVLGTAIVEAADGPPPPEKFIALPLT